MKRDLVYIHHILDAIQRIEDYTKEGKDAFMNGHHWQDATVRQLEIIGEATKRISEQLRDSHPDIPWRRMAGLRDVLIHEYMGVDLNAVWEIAKKNIPDLKMKLSKILKNEE